MKSSLSGFLIVTITVLAACSPSKTTTLPDTSTTEGQSFKPERPIPYEIEEPWDFQQAVEDGFRTFEGTPGSEYFTNTYSYKIDTELVPADTMLYGEADITYTNHSPDTLNYILFELAQNLHKEGVPRKEIVEITGGMNITRVSIGGEDIAGMKRSRPTYVEQGTNLVVYPNERILPGQTTELEIDWNFKVPQAGASGRMGYSRNNLFFIAYWFPHISTYDDVHGWFGDDFTGNAEFYHDFGDYEINIKAPEQWLVMSTGEFLNPEEVLAPAVLDRYNTAQQSDTVVSVVEINDFGSSTISGEDGTLTWRFKADKVRDVAFSATSQSQWDALQTPVGDVDGDGSEDYSTINAFWRESAPLWKEAADYTAHSISFLSDYTSIPYPWPHMTSVEGAGIIGGGMEFPMMTIMGSYNNPNPNIPLSQKRQALYNVTAHEIAHMWIPMIVSNNERRHAWMDEGATTFHEAHARWDKFPDSFSRLEEFNSYLPIAGSYLEGEIMRWSDYHYPGPAYGVASYPKPATVLIALQGVLGDDLFKEAWTSFMNRWAYKHPTPYDMFNTFEDVSGRELDWFWRSWYFETWTLDQAIADVTEDDGQVTITIEDLGKAVMPVDLTITFDDGSETTTRIDVDDWMMGKRTTSVTLDAPAGVTRVEIDADHYFPDTNRENNIWLR
ncbi:M1 family metallopeptidase [Gracilimonas sp.]|uniref:M1 family metallopeptidase n=1 Tax=Gracilimonas sp. TaxID=1974203 RepID=UPI003BAB6223